MSSTVGRCSPLKYLHALRFFTAWNAILVLMHAYTHRYVNLVYTSLVCTAVGFYLSHVSPGVFRFTFGDKRYTVDKWTKLVFVDLIMHVCVLVFAMTLPSSADVDLRLQTLGTILVAGVYTFSFDIAKTYGIPRTEMLKLVAGCTLVYVVFRALSCSSCK
jgi:hypothetical protein